MQDHKPLNDNKHFIVRLTYIEGDSDDFPFGVKASAIAFRDRARKRRDVVSVDLLEARTTD